MKYQVIVSDPSWAFGDRLQKMKSPTKRSAASQYKTLSTAQVSRLDVPSLVDPSGCVLALWVPSTLLEHGLRVMHDWGFQLKQTFIWVKSKKKIKSADPNDCLAFGMGRLFRQTHEIALIGTAGKTIYPLLEDHSQRSVVMAPNEGHSIKPPALQDRLDVMFPAASKLEMFCRRQRVGWECIGDAVTGEDITQSIQRLIVL